MAKQKPKSRAAAKTAALKKSPARKTASKTVAKSAARKTKARALPAAKPRPRPKQRIAISHHREEDFKADGLRTYAQYRDLGIAEASHGLAQAHVIRLIGPCNPAEVSKLHFHDVEFQMVYVLKGWIKTNSRCEPSFRGDAERRTRNLEIPGPREDACPGMTVGLTQYPHDRAYQAGRQRA